MTNQHRADIACAAFSRYDAGGVKTSMRGTIETVTTPDERQKMSTDDWDDIHYRLKTSLWLLRNEVRL